MRRSHRACSKGGFHGQAHACLNRYMPAAANPPQPRMHPGLHSLLMALSAVCLPTSPSSSVSKAGSTMPCTARVASMACTVGTSSHPLRLVVSLLQLCNPCKQVTQQPIGGARPLKLTLLLLHSATAPAAPHLAVAGHAAQLLVHERLVYELAQRAGRQEVGVQQQHHLRMAGHRCRVLAGHV